MDIRLVGARLGWRLRGLVRRSNGTLAFAGVAAVVGASCDYVVLSLAIFAGAILAVMV